MLNICVLFYIFLDIVWYLKIYYSIYKNNIVIKNILDLNNIIFIVFMINIESFNFKFCIKYNIKITGLEPGSPEFV